LKDQDILINRLCFLQLSDKCIRMIHELLPKTDIVFKIMDDHGRWQLELDEAEAMNNMYETEPLLEDHNRDKVYHFEKHLF